MNTLEEKVGQVLMVHFYGTTATKKARRLIQELHVGGFIYYNWSNGLHIPTQIKKLSHSLQKISKTPLLIAVDQEGGRVTRLKNGFTKLPPNRNVQNAYITACTVGTELKNVGINMNLAPVVDIDSNPKNPIIGDRSFGNNAETVIIKGSQALDGYQLAGIIATLKHFPGHGDVEVDSHKDLPILAKSLNELEELELRPFAELAHKARAIMTAHLLVPAFDPDNCSTLSKRTLTYLKETLKFKGVIISDSLTMQGVLKKTQTVAEAAIQALSAGCDILLLGGKQEGKSKTLTFREIQFIHSSLVEAVKSGRIPESRLDDAVSKIYKLKILF